MCVRRSSFNIGYVRPRRRCHSPASVFSLPSRTEAHQLGVQPAGRKQLGVRPLLDHPPAVKHNDATARMVERRCAMIRAVRPAIAPSRARCRRASVSLSTLAVASSRMQNRWVAIERAGEGNELALPGREVVPAFDDRGLEPLGAALEQVECSDARQGPEHFLADTGMASPVAMFVTTVPGKR